MVAQSQFAERLAEVRARAAHLRCEAFVDYAPTVCGIVLHPVTLASYNRLLAFGNAFACGGPISDADVLAWVWIHHPTFGQFAASERACVVGRAGRYLRTRAPNFNRFILFVSTLPRFRWLRFARRRTTEEKFEASVTEIRRLMDEALRGFPRGQSEEDAATDAAERAAEAAQEGARREPEAYQPGASVAFQAQLLNTFRRNYAMSYAETESIPLKKLAQLWREHLWMSSNDKTGLRLMEPEEAALWRDALAPKEASRGL